MPHRLIAKLEHFARLSPAECEALRAIMSRRRRIQPRADIVREREEPGPINVMLEGWACRYKQLKDGRRQIVSICLPGDVCGSPMRVLAETDHSIAALTPVTVAEVAPEGLAAVVSRHPRIGQALTWEAQVEASIQREWTVNLGQRDASERLGHLFCELSARLHAVGLLWPDGCEMPLRQIDLAVALGLTNVHVNRSLQALRAQRLVALRGRRLTILDLDRLQRLSLFDPHYLHFAHATAGLDDGDRAACAVGAGAATGERIIALF